MEEVLGKMQPIEAAVFLRQGFVLPDDLTHFNSNPEDAGRFTNHSSTPTIGFDGALRDIQPGEELTMDYAWHGDPGWYQELCARIEILSHHTHFISEQVPLETIEMPRLKSIRDHCAQVDSELSALEKDVLEKFRNKVDWENIMQISNTPELEREAAEVENFLSKPTGDFASPSRYHFSTKSSSLEPPTANRWLLPGRPKNPLRGQKTGLQLCGLRV
ncbi:unnamed protein product [Symbiodinium microadriaticum]|nr:unnamed protein product [Symbiodinium microadriaticum]